MKLHSFQEEPTQETETDERVLDDFVIVRRLGKIRYGTGYKGGASVVAEVNFKKAKENEAVISVAVKMMVFDQVAVRDSKIAGQLNELKRATPLYLHAHGWFVSTGIPGPWRRTMKTYPGFYNTETLLCYVMDYAEHSFNDDTIVLTDVEIKNVLLILLHGLTIAKRQIGFVHGDLHEDQILLTMQTTPAFMALRVGNDNLTIKMGRFIPKLIDFGFSATAMHPEPSFESESSFTSSSTGSVKVRFSNSAQDEDEDDNDSSELILRETNDISNVLDAVYKCMKRQSLPTEEFKRFATTYETHPLEVMIYNSGYFDDIILEKKPVPQGAPLIARCIACFDAAKLEWQHTGMTFCSHQCSNYWRPFRGIVPLQKE